MKKTRVISRSWINIAALWAVILALVLVRAPGR
jgi:hypothetical protein